jgi:hypothetical protein
MEDEEQSLLNVKRKYAALNIPRGDRRYEYAIRAVSVNCHKLIHGRIDLEGGEKDIIYLYKFTRKRKFYELLRILPFEDWWNFEINTKQYEAYKRMIYNNGGCVRYNKFVIEIRWESNEARLKRIKKIMKSDKYNQQITSEEMKALQEKQRLKNEKLQPEEENDE